MEFWYLLHMGVTKAHTSMRIKLARAFPAQPHKNWTKVEAQVAIRPIT